MNISRLFAKTFFWVVLLFSCPANIWSQEIACRDDSVCAAATGLDSSICRPDGFCSNPFERGCFHALKPDWNNRRDGLGLRVCNSMDSQQATNALGDAVCHIPEIDYLEIRLFAQTWESPVYENWLIQILLSELLNVPTTIETGTFESEISFYDPTMRFEYGNNHDTNSLEVATRLDGDCSKASKVNDTYEYCAHLVPEVWDVKTSWVQEKIRNGIIAPPLALGVLGQEGWFVTKFTAEKDPTVTSYLGLMGEDNREKLAKLFKRPMRWGDYCAELSTNNCTIPDETASRAPKTDWERDRFFVDETYKGHFRYTDRNNCTKFPANCTGHMADYPCGWSNYAQGQLFYLNISLESNGREPGMGGYTSTELPEIWKAANATKENLIMYWYAPDRTYQMFLGSDSEFQRVTFPPPTQECSDNRPLVIARCSDDKAERVGTPKGICDESASLVSKLLSPGLETATNDPSIPPALKSPALDVLRYFTISELQLGEMTDALIKYSTPREAICRWAVDNIEILEAFIPSSYPRVIREGADKYKELTYISVIFGSFALLLVLITTAAVYTRRTRRIMQYAQVEFLMLLLAGSFFVALGAIIKGFDATNESCVASEWFINIGYTLELVPLIVKISALNRLATAARRLRRIQVSKRSLFYSTFAFSFLVVPFLVVWTAWDPPSRDSDYTLTKNQTPEGDTIVQVSYHCASKMEGWKYVSVGWNVILLLTATTMAFQARDCRSEFNESSSLGTLIYSHFIFVVMRVVVYFLTDYVNLLLLQKVTSLIFCFDTVATLVIYFIPKIFEATFSKRSSLQRTPSFDDFELLGSSSRTSVRQKRNHVFASREQDLNSCNIQDSSSSTQLKEKAKEGSQNVNSSPKQESSNQAESISDHTSDLIDASFRTSERRLPASNTESDQNEDSEYG